MGNVNLPTPVALAGGAICLLGGYLVGVLAGPDTASRATATVASYDSGTGRLCLGGDGVQGQAASTRTASCAGRGVAQGPPARRATGSGSAS